MNCAKYQNRLAISHHPRHTDCMFQIQMPYASCECDSWTWKIWFQLTYGHKAWTKTRSNTSTQTRTQHAYLDTLRLKNADVRSSASKPRQSFHFSYIKIHYILMGWLLVGRFVVDVVGLSSYRQNVSIVQRQNDEDRTYIFSDTSHKNRTYVYI